MSLSFRLPSRLPMPARVLLALGLVQVAESAVAWACSCQQIADPVAEVDTYEQVFVGEVKSTRTGCGASRLGTTRIEVTEAFKGAEVGEVVRLEHHTDGAACGVEFDAGEAYLVYASQGSTNLCAPGGLLVDNEDIVEDLRESYGG